MTHSTTPHNKNMDNSIFTTEIVRGLFCPNIDPIISTYKCSHQRASGRLYIASSAVFFYSNIFGFERKLMIRVMDITFVGLTRSTSIIIRSKIISTTTTTTTTTTDTDTAAAAATTTTTSINNANNANNTTSNTNNVNPDSDTTVPALGTSNINNINNNSNTTNGDVFEEEHIFKSFDEREVVLRTLLDLMGKERSNHDHNLTHNRNNENDNYLDYENNNSNTNSDNNDNVQQRTMKRLEAPTNTNTNTNNSNSPSKSTYFTKRKERRNSSRNNFGNNSNNNNSESMKSLRLRTYSDPRDCNQDTCHGATTTFSSFIPNRMRTGSTPDWRRNKDFFNRSASNLTIVQQVDQQVPIPVLAPATVPIPVESDSLLQQTQQTQQPMEVKKEDNVISPNVISTPTVATPAVAPTPTTALFDELRGTFKTSHPELIVNSYTIPNCTINEFHKKFLIDDAPYSLEVFQHTIIKDQNIELSAWSNAHCFQQHSSVQQHHHQHHYQQQRSMSFIHPRNAKLGPSSAQVNQQQVCQVFVLHLLFDDLFYIVCIPHFCGQKNQ